MRGIRISKKDIRNAFSWLISNASLDKDQCFGFFIDGLDEYKRNHQDDAKFLADVLRSWTSIVPSNVKLCVSSREYNVFMNAFSPEKRIRLHELIRGDMIQYVADKLGHKVRQKMANSWNLLWTMLAGCFCESFPWSRDCESRSKTAATWTI